MGEEERPLRHGVGRREEDILCQEHREKINQFETEISSIATDVHHNSGKFTSMLWFMGIAGGFIGACLVFLVAKTSAIESLLTDGKVKMAEQGEQLKQLRSDVTTIQDKHKWEEQNNFNGNTNGKR
jgi:hypothetical protein